MVNFRIFQFRFFTTSLQKTHFKSFLAIAKNLKKYILYYASFAAPEDLTFDNSNTFVIYMLIQPEPTKKKKSFFYFTNTYIMAEWSHATLAMCCFNNVLMQEIK